MAMDSSKATPPAPRVHVMVQAIPVVTRAEHTAGGRELTEGYLAQWIAMGSGTGARRAPRVRRHPER